MKYIALIYSATGAEAGYEGDMMADYGQFNQDAIAASVFIAGDALMPVSDASSVQVRAGSTAITDGPFAETKEVLGGYYLLECADLDEAIKWAAKIPTAKYGTIEVRPIMTFDQ
jgi:hypothetical protein